VQNGEKLYVDSWSTYRGYSLSGDAGGSVSNGPLTAAGVARETGKWMSKEALGCPVVAAWRRSSEARRQKPHGRDLDDPSSQLATQWRQPGVPHVSSVSGPSSASAMGAPSSSSSSSSNAFRGPPHDRLGGGGYLGPPHHPSSHHGGGGSGSRYFAHPFRRSGGGGVGDDVKVKSSARDVRAGGLGGRKPYGETLVANRSHKTDQPIKLTSTNLLRLD
jgi:hypothetical protein